MRRVDLDEGSLGTDLPQICAYVHKTSTHMIILRHRVQTIAWHREMGSIPTDFTARAGSPEQSVRYLQPSIVGRGGVEYILEMRLANDVRERWHTMSGIVVYIGLPAPISLFLALP
jgi:hypothetical protein